MIDRDDQSIGNRNTLDEASLAQLGEITLARLNTAIQMGDTKQALGLAANLHNELKGMHDLFLLWNASLFSYIGKHGGDEAVANAMQTMLQTGYPGEEQGGNAFEDLTDRKRLEQVAASARGHGEAFKVKENEGSYDLLIEQCGSGGQLIRRGVYEGSKALYKMQAASPITYGQAGFTPYCTHCYFTGELCPKGVNDKPIVEVIPADNPGHGTCICRIHKQES